MEKKISTDFDHTPYRQLKLYGYKEYFYLFKDLFLKNNLPQVNLITGRKGLGKSTFVFHLINYFLSMKEVNPYSLNNFTISPINKTYNLMTNNIHPNFFLLEKLKNSKFIDVDQIRTLIKNLNLSSYNKNFRFVIINDIENLNKNSANALLKTLEEPPKNTFLFLIYDSSYSLLDTIKSRSIEFKINLTSQNKKEIFTLLCDEHLDGGLDKKIIFNEIFDTPGSSFNYVNFYSKSNIQNNTDKRETIKDLTTYYLKNKNKICLNLIFNLIETYFVNLISLYPQNVNLYTKRDKILNLISNMTVYNLDEKNTFFEVMENLPYEQK